MKVKKQVVDEIIKSLTENRKDWIFGDCTVENITNGISIWIANIPILHLSIWKPTKVSFSLRDRYRIYKALDVCRNRMIIDKLNNN